MKVNIKGKYMTEKVEYSTFSNQIFPIFRNVEIMYPVMPEFPYYPL